VGIFMRTGKVNEYIAQLGAFAALMDDPTTLLTGVQESIGKYAGKQQCAKKTAKNAQLCERIEKAANACKQLAVRE